jgi:uncharacterized protein YecE (DUF72 family)
MPASTLYVGTAGWSVHSRYADRIAEGGSSLERYGRHLTAAEINSSFHRPHKRATYQKWAASVPAGFRFSVKIPKTITHERRLVDCAEPLGSFLDEAGGLGEKLGVLLVQLPPSLAFDARTADAFFGTLGKRTGADIACEPRHVTWFTDEAGGLLAKRHVARVAADPARAESAAVPGGWSDLVYYRLHGSPRMYVSDYDAAWLARLRRRLAGYRATGARVWCIFDNTVASFALGNALTILPSRQVRRTVAG